MGRTGSQAVRPATIFLVVVGVVLWIPLLSLLLGRDGRFLADLGFFSGPRGTAEGWILAFVVAGLFTGYAIRNIPLVRAHWLRVSPLKLVGVLVAVAAAVVEEAFFRRVLMDWVATTGGTVVVQVLVSGLVFGLAHGLWGVVTGRLQVGVGVTLATGVLGLGLAAVYAISDRSLAPVIVAHFLVTASIQPGITLAAFSGTMGPRPAPG